jgi:hypothetical protein
MRGVWRRRVAVDRIAASFFRVSESTGPRDFDYVERGITIAKYPRDATLRRPVDRNTQKDPFQPRCRPYRRSCVQEPGRPEDVGPASPREA